MPSAGGRGDRNRLEVAQTLKAYEGLAPKKLLVGQVPFVEDAEKAMEEMEKEKRI